MNTESTSRPNVQILLVALILSIAIPFAPFGDLVVAPLTIFVTFIHEIFHLVAGLATGGKVRSLTVSIDGSGMVLYETGSDLASAITSSAGYMGTVFFGTLLMAMLRKGTSGNRLLSVIGWIFIGSTLLFGFFVPLVNLFWLPISFLSILFTTGSGLVIGFALVFSGRLFARPLADFALAFLAIQCILNGFGDILFLMQAHSGTVAFEGHSDAVNMENITGIPAIAWSVKWMAISLVLVIFAVVSYARSKE